MLQLTSVRSFVKMNAIISLTFHGCCAVFHTYAIHWLMFTIGLNILEMASFFTVWTTMFHLVMFICLTAYDATRLFSGSRISKYTEDSQSVRSFETSHHTDVLLGLLIHLAIVMSSFNQFGFWILFYVDREMILPESTGLPRSLNHMLHTFPLLLALFTRYIFVSNFPNVKADRLARTVSQAASKLITFILFAYLTLIWILFELKGVWPYLFMFSFKRFEYLIFCLASFLFSFILCYICSFVKA